MKTQGEVKEWQKSIEGEIRHHVVLIITVAMVILSVMAIIANCISTGSLLSEVSGNLDTQALSSVRRHSAIIMIINIIVILAVAVILIVIASGLALKLAKVLGEAVKVCTDRLELLTQGDLHSPVPEVDRNDETGVLAEATKKMVATMETMIGDISYVLSNMGEGNFAVRSKARESFIGDFADILENERKIEVRLSETVFGIREVASQVSLGSTQLSESAQNLAEGATDQASSVEELLATVTDVTERVMKNAEETAAVGRNAEKMGIEAQESTKQMEQMKAAMEKISQTSAQISGVIQSIEEIAEQTNLLALNASIEAARAGESGRGFAVVANEIGALAKQSGDAAENTKQLIEDSLREVENGHEIVNITAKTLGELISGLAEIVREIEEVGVTSMKQTDMIKQINVGIEQISAVTEENSASAQECSATSEELNAQAVNMNEMMEKFQIRE